MELKSQLATIANYLTTRRESKKHGGYNIYADDKIEISYDTYYPNVDVYVFIEGKKNLAALYSGHGYTQEFHNGAWVKYVTDTLYPKAVEAKNASDLKRKEKESSERASRSSPLNDSSTFA